MADKRAIHAIRSMTLSYDTAEDRLQLAMLLSDGERVRMWLTQRLARSLITALRTYLEKAEGIPLPAVRTAMLSHEQARAAAGIKPRRPVRAKADERSFLIAKVGLKQGRDKIRMIFQTEGEFSTGLVFEKTALRQWLDMLFRKYLTTGWPRDIWPEWVSDAAAPASSSATRH